MPRLRELAGDIFIIEVDPERKKGGFYDYVLYPLDEDGRPDEVFASVGDSIDVLELQLDHPGALEAIQDGETRFIASFDPEVDGRLILVAVMRGLGAISNEPPINIEARPRSPDDQSDWL